MLQYIQGYNGIGDFISAMLTDIDERPSAAELLEHPWLEDLPVKWTPEGERTIDLPRSIPCVSESLL